MSTHNIHIHPEIRKILCEYPLLSVAMDAQADSSLCWEHTSEGTFSHFAD